MADPDLTTPAPPSIMRTHPAPIIAIGPDSLPLHCPTGNMAIWNSHPRVFLDLAASGQAQCPYCGALYRLAPGMTPPGRH